MTFSEFELIGDIPDKVPRGLAAEGDDTTEEGANSTTGEGSPCLLIEETSVIITESLALDGSRIKIEFRFGEEQLGVDKLKSIFGCEFTRGESDEGRNGIERGVGVSAPIGGGGIGVVVIFEGHGDQCGFGIGSDVSREVVGF